MDEALSFSGLRELALRFRAFSADDVFFTTAPIAEIAARRGGQSVVLLDEVASEQLFTNIARDVAPADLPPPPGPGQELVVPPGQIRVEVLNGAGIPGLGARAAADLKAVGFVIAGAPGHRPGEAAGTVVLHGPDKADSARTLAAALPGATVELDEELDRTLQVVAGSAYTPAVPVTVSGATPPPSAPAPDTASSDPCGI